MEYVELSEIKDYKKFGTLLAYTNKNIVISTQKKSIDDQCNAVKEILTEYKKNIQKGIQTIIIDEGHKFAPEGQTTPSKAIVRAMFQENRSDGLGVIIVTQRPARLDKTILSQCDNLLLGRVTSYTDKQAIMNYIDTKEDMEKISKLEIGEMFFYGFGQDQATINKVRKSSTEHSGGTPEHLLSEKKELYQKYASRIIKKQSKEMKDMSEKDLVKNVVPSMDTFKDFAVMGAKMSLGLGATAIVGNMTQSIVPKSPIPVISSRTLGSTAGTIVMYSAYKMFPNEKVKDILKYGVAGSSVYTAGSLIADVLVVSPIKIPTIVNTALGLTTGVTGQQESKKEGSVKDSEEKAPDLNTYFQ